MTPVAMIRAGKWPSAEGQVCAPGTRVQTAVGGLKSQLNHRLLRPDHKALKLMS